MQKALADYGAQVAVVSCEAERHCALSVQAANAGLHVVQDKPMSNRLSECDRLVRAVERNRVRFLMWNRNFLPAVEKGVRQVMNEGAIAGFALQDVRVSVYDGKHHPVDSKEVAFVAAGRKAFITAIREAGPIVLEPVVRVTITSPASAIGVITSDLATRRARINGQDTLPGGRAEITALVPLAELTDYLSRLKALTGGEGSYTMDLSHYDPVPARKQQELIAAFKPREEAD